MAIITKNYTFSAGATIIAAEHNSDFDTLYNEFNGNIDNNNIKLNATIADTKLAQIATAAKVSGTAITGLASLPAGAGVIPNANMMLEGDWTAAFTCGTSGTITIDNSYKTGRYIKIGNQVTVTGYFAVNSVSNPVGELLIYTLPFACGTGAKYFSAVNVWAHNLNATATTTIIGKIDATANYIHLQHFTAGANAAMAADVNADSAFVISATYFTD